MKAADGQKEPQGGFFGRLSLELRYAGSDALQAPRNFFVGLATIFIVVMFVTLLQNAIVRSNSVFVRLSEQQVGENDIVFAPDISALATAGSQEFWLNQVRGASSQACDHSRAPPLPKTFMNETLSSIPDLAGIAPRWTIPARALTPPPGSISGPLLPTTRAQVNASCILLVFDTLLEQQLGIGRTWTRRALASDETYVSGNLLRGSVVLFCLCSACLVGSLQSWAFRVEGATRS
jgi:hypothetical protein